MGDVRTGLKGERWYAIQTKPRKEASVERRLKEQEREVFLPWIRLRRRVNTRFAWTIAPLFPGYLFSRLDLSLHGRTVRYTPGVKDFVKFGDLVPQMDEDTLRVLKERCPNGIAEVKPPRYDSGERVLIKEGALRGIEAAFERELNARQRVAVLLELLGRQTRLVVSAEKIGRP